MWINATALTTALTTAYRATAARQNLPGGRRRLGPFEVHRA
jgi:hypothetical protein